jgi:hypothetical protein
MKEDQFFKGEYEGIGSALSSPSRQENEGASLALGKTVSVVHGIHGSDAVQGMSKAFIAFRPLDSGHGLCPGGPTSRRSSGERSFLMPPASIACDAHRPLLVWQRHLLESYWPVT